MVLLLSLLQLRNRQGVQLASLMVVLLARLFLWIFNIRLHCPDRETIRQHRGLIVANHLSYADIIVIYAIAPVRFMSTAGVRRIPFIGWIASAVGTIFVNRWDAKARSSAKEELATELLYRPYPPLALFPEGGTGPGDQLLRFRRGAFEVAIDAAVSCLPCAISYRPLDAIHYHAKNDTLPKAVWRLATWPTHINAIVTPLPPLEFTPSYEPASAGEMARQAIAKQIEVDQASR